MNEQSLPQNYKGYSTAELLKVWRDIPGRKHTDQPTPRQKVSAMDGLLREHRLAPVYWGTGEEYKANMIQSRKLLKPFGIKPAPWADANGNELPEEVRAAWHKKLEQEEAARRTKTASS
ncbi:MAG: hypothetical protein LBN96_02345 [Desulfovibrio sp.]|jgi:hypothetical protein|nr:hypothetical protein [Desulfovibrio sp.]